MREEASGLVRNKIKRNCIARCPHKRPKITRLLHAKKGGSFSFDMKVLNPKVADMKLDVTVRGLHV